eukprot:227167_1
MVQKVYRTYNHMVLVAIIVLFAAISVHSEPMDKPCECNENKGSSVCCGDKTFDNTCQAECNGYKGFMQCVDGVCASKYEGLFSLNSPQQYTAWNIIIIIIQLLVLCVCCMGIGCILPLIVDQIKYTHCNIAKTKDMTYDQELCSPNKLAVRL